MIKMRCFGNKCQRIRRLLSDRVDAPLSARKEKKVSAHLETCSACREEFAFYQDLKEAAAQVERISPPPYLWERISVDLDEHPWGEEETVSYGRNKFTPRALTGRINLAGALLSLILIAVLSLSPSGISHDSKSRFGGVATPESISRGLEYVSLYLMANQDRFPSQVRNYYIGHMQGLNQKIQTIKSALEKYPQNNHIRAQLAMAYRQKIDLYEQMGLEHENSGGSTLPGDFSGDDFRRGARYE